MKSFAHSILVVILALFLGACSIPNLDKDLKKSQRTIDKDWIIPRLGSSADNQIIRLSWEEAHQLMVDQNISWLRNNQALYRSKKAISRVYKDLIPIIDIDLSLSEMFRNLDELSFDDLRLDGRGNFIIPGILQLSENLYSRKLAYLRTEAQRENQYRQLFLNLRSFFEKKRILREQLPLSTLLRSIKVDARNSIDLEEFDQIDKEIRSLNQEISQFFGMPYREWELIGEPPSIQILDKNLQLDKNNLWAKLQRKELAIDLAAIAARIEGIRFDYWPDLRASITGTSLFRRANGETSYWDPGDTLLNLRLNYSFDLNRQISDNLKLARVDYLVVKKSIDAGLAEMTYKLASANEDLIEARTEAASIRKELQLVRELLEENALPADQSTIRLLVNTLRKSVQAETQIGEIESTLIFFYEPYWNAHPTPSPIDFDTYDHPKTILEN